MYEDRVPTASVKTPEHISYAQDFANQSMEKFEPHQLNEIVSKIKNMFEERRKLQIEEAEKKLSYLKESLQGIS